MGTATRPRLSEIESRVCDITSEQLGIPRQQVLPESRFIEDLSCDSLDVVELLMEVEETFDVTLPDKPSYPVYKAVFTRSPFRVSDLAELVYMQQGTGVPDRSIWRNSPVTAPRASMAPFSQLEGRWLKEPGAPLSLLEKLPQGDLAPQYRRRTDGMRCVLIPAATVEIGSDNSAEFADEQPLHRVALDSFLIDAEPVSTTAYCRFLNSIGDVPPEVLAEWFVLTADDDRCAHMLIERSATDWRPVPGAERWPMILVSWYGANAYSLWANDRNWQDYTDEHPIAECCLPTEAQWEYAARGTKRQDFPWGAASATQNIMRFGQHCRSLAYGQGVLPLADVNEELGMSPFGLHHMAGNVWQWCRDWYAEDFYGSAEATQKNAVNRRPGKARSERGGSWVGPATLCRSSYRRGRPPHARGRCLGFRCTSPVGELP